MVSREENTRNKKCFISRLYYEGRNGNVVGKKRDNFQYKEKYVVYYKLALRK